MDQSVIGVVGLGTMGLGIAQVYAQAGHAVRATDAFAPARANARERLAAALSPGTFDEGPARRFADLNDVWATPGARANAVKLRDWVGSGREGRLAGFAGACETVFRADQSIRSFATGEKKAPGLAAAAADFASQLCELQDFDLRVIAAETAARVLRAGHRVVDRYRRLKRAAVAGKIFLNQPADDLPLPGIGVLRFIDQNMIET